MEEKCGSEPTEFWQILNRLPLAQKTTSVNLDHKEVYDQISKLSFIPNQAYFERDFEKEVKTIIENCDSQVYDTCLNNKELCKVVNNNISIDEIEYAVRKLKSGKCIDRIPVECIKETIDVIKYDLQSLYNYVLACEKFPDSWGQSL